MGDNLVRKVIKELQKLGASLYYAPFPDKLTRFTDFTRVEAGCKDYLQGVVRKAQIGAFIAVPDDEVYDLARPADISATSTPLAVFNDLREFLGSFDHPFTRSAVSHRQGPRPGS
ncbi:unnamed protein product [Schistocephalus solidus]|uniref:Glycine--tRNA ligase n=1 Tax=Schistocephalus solidus TaxID=70667 RepID=A0A183SBK9_SCHSO|nr:unnamed protein product [Schistocephalus solidus]